MTIRGSVDVVQFDRASGWIADPKGRPLPVEAILDNQIIGQSVASLPRPDLAGAGLTSTDCGYEIGFYRHIDMIYLPFISVRLAGSDLFLPRTTPTGFTDVMAHLHARFPAASRYRTLLGGLWTDRSDGIAALDGRLATGLVSDDMAPMLETFIGTGRLVLPGEVTEPSVAPGNAPVRQELALSAARRLDAGTLRLIAAVLEDRPVVVVDDAAMAEPGFRQAGEGDVPSPAECLTLLILGGDTPSILETVRDSHTLPEFSQGGTSRWMMTGAEIGAHLAASHAAMVDETPLQPGDTAVLAPGLLYRLRPRGGTEQPAASVIRAHAMPARLASLRAGLVRSVVLDGPIGTRIWA